MSARGIGKLRQRRPTMSWILACVVLICAGSVLLGFALHTGPRPPKPRAQDATASLGPIRSSSSGPSSSAAHGGPAASSAVPGASSRPSTPGAVAAQAVAEPVALAVPTVGISTRLMQLGRQADGAVEVPPLTRNAPAGWYRQSPAPGQNGASVILGHIDSAAYGPGVFFRLGAVHRGDAIDVRRTDGSTAVFRADRVAEYPKSAFPTQLVYGATTYPSLRLITCGGHFNTTLRSYDDNVVVYATLTATHS